MPILWAITHAYSTSLADADFNIVDKPASLLLQRGSGKISHAGGDRLFLDSYVYRDFYDWIAGGAKIDSLASARARMLKVTPTQQVTKPGESYPLKVEATYAYRSRQDVTRYCSFESLDKTNIMVYFNGGPSHLDMYDLNPAAPLELIVQHLSNRGQFPDGPLHDSCRATDYLFLVLNSAATVQALVHHQIFTPHTLDEIDNVGKAMK